VGSKNKLKRFRENETFSNVIQPKRDELLADTFALKGHWRESFFKNDQPIVLELGCGKGEYTLALAKRDPNKNYIGIDIKGARFWKGAKTALADELQNVGFLRIQIELLTYCFAEGEIDEIWITFPDPQIKYKRTKHRLTNREFLKSYQKVLRSGGLVHLKTDSEFMHGYTLGLLHGLGQDIHFAQHDVYGTTGTPEVVTAVQTFYESQYLAEEKKITYISFSLSGL
jgi:tRNA (guanine-N7-)-methyltransferase